MKIELSPFDQNWKQRFESEKAKMVTALANPGILIEHVGSTSIEGLIAKPIIDVMIGLPEESLLDSTIDAFIAAGYTYNSYYTDLIPERRFYQQLVPLTKGYSIPQVIDSNENYRSYALSEVNVHTVVIGRDWWIRHLHFRDTLRNNEQLKYQYAELKTKLAQKEWASVNDYAAAKSDFIQQFEKPHL